MQCPECEYMMAAADTDCPRCRSRREGGALAPLPLPVHIGPERDTPDPYPAAFLPPPQYPTVPYPGQQPPYQGQPPPQYPPQYPPAPYPPYPYRPDIIQMPPGTHSVAAAVILALLFNGAGQMMNRQVTKGIVLLLSAIVLGAITLGIAWLLITVLALVDAVCIANRLNRGEPVGLWQWF